MPSPESSKPAVRRRPPPRIVEVRQVTPLTPHMQRITFGGSGMVGFMTNGVAEHIRLYLPNETTGNLVLPVLGIEGYAFPEDEDRPASRAYTPRRWDPQANELDVDFVVHGEGPGSEWASKARVGDVAVISGQPGGAYIPETDVDWYLIASDEAALPAVATLLEVLQPPIFSHVFVEVLNAREEQVLESAAETKVTWIHRESTQITPGLSLATYLHGVELPEGKGVIWVSCEASVMRDIRRHFLEERGIDRSVLRTQGYWRLGSVNHSDHDMGDDI